VSHAFTGAFQQAQGIHQLGSMEKADVRVGPKDVDVAKWRIFHTRHRTSVMHELADIVAALPHAGEPTARNGTKPYGLRAQPTSMAGYAVCWEPQNRLHARECRNSL
jgi:hypothetical protein